MKVLHIVQNYHPSVGGSQDLMRNFSERMVSTYGDDVTVYTSNAMQAPTPDVELIERDEEVLGGVRVRRFPFARKTMKPVRLALRYARRAHVNSIASFLELFQLGPVSPAMFRAIMQSDAHVIGGTSAPYLHMFYPALAARLGRRIPFVCYGALHLHERDISAPTLAMIKAADAYVAHTTFERDYLIDRDVDPSRIHIVGAGVDLARFEHANGRIARDKYGLGNDPVVGFIGRQTAYKGVDTLIRAMRDVWRAVPDARLLVAGVRTNFSSKVDELIASLTPAERARIVVVDGFPADEKPHLMAACDVFVTISKAESFGIVYLEAWACERPVIAGRIGAVQSIVSEGEDALTSEIGNSSELASAIVQLLQNESLRTKMGRNGRTKVQSRYTWDIVTAKLRSVYETVQR